MKQNVQNTTLVRDMNTKAILETNIDKYIEFKKRQQFAKRIISLENTLKEILGKNV